MMEGYAKLSRLMASQEEFAMLRSFRHLNMQNLLYLQAELTHLETELKELIDRDAAHVGRQFHAKDWWSLSQGDEEEDTEQWTKFLEIRNKLEKYNDALVKQAYLARLDRPRRYDADFLRSWLRRPGMGAFPLLGIDKDSWDRENENDFVAIKARLGSDTFSNWFTEKLVPAYHHILGEKFKESLPEDIGSGIYHYKENKLKLILDILTTVVSSILPISSVVALYFIHSSGLKLGMVVVFSAVFSFALALMTNARKAEIFAATSAFAAVNVVFLSNNSPCNTSTVAGS